MRDRDLRIAFSHAWQWISWTANVCCAIGCSFA
jgi:hypothetical protein